MGNGIRLSEFHQVMESLVITALGQKLEGIGILEECFSWKNSRQAVRAGTCARGLRTNAAVQQSRPRAAQHGESSGRQRGSVRPRRLRRLGPAQPRQQGARGAGTVHGGANHNLPPASACLSRALGVCSVREAPDLTYHTL